jgi:hypothetical protein
MNGCQLNIPVSLCSQMPVVRVFYPVREQSRDSALPTGNSMPEGSCPVEAEGTGGGTVIFQQPARTFVPAVLAPAHGLHWTASYSIIPRRQTSKNR